MTPYDGALTACGPPSGPQLMASVAQQMMRWASAVPWQTPSPQEQAIAEYKNINLKRRRADVTDNDVYLEKFFFLISNKHHSINDAW